MGRQAFITEWTQKKNMLLFTVVFFKLSNTIFQNTLSANATLVLSSLSYFRI